jgi:hypothetical protein
MQPNYFIMYLGTDCDGYEHENKCIDTFYSKQYAEKICNSYNKHSDGITAHVIPLKEFKKHYEESNMNFYYFPFISSPYFIGDNK